MDPKVSYTLVGLFVVILGSALVFVVFWLSAGTSKAVYETYVAYVYESVSGLNPRAAVNYRGVAVGQVSKIALDRENPERVILLLDVEAGTPVKEDTVAVIATQGITGLARVELTGGSAGSPALQARPGQPYPEIPTKPSLLVRLDTAVSALLTQLTQAVGQLGSVAQRVNAILGDDQQQKLANTLTHVEHITGALAARADTLVANLESLTAILRNTAQTSAELPALVTRISGSLGTVQETIGAISRTSSHLDQLIVHTQKGLTHFSRDTLPQVSPLLIEVRQSTESLRRLTEQLERNPSSLLFGRPTSRPGPGE